MGYNPREQGALCDYCPLRGLPVVPPQVPASDVKVAFCAEAPGENEEKEGKPLVGWSGKVFLAAIEAAGFKKEEVLKTNAVLCRPRDAKNKNAPPPKEAIACCRPRLERELVSIQTVVAMGAVAVSSIAPTAFIGSRNKQRGITSIRGYAISLSGGRILLPTVHPAFTLRSRNWTPSFFADIRKAKTLSDKCASGESGITARPPTAFARTVEDVVHAVEHFNNKRISVDVETTRDHPLQARLKCVGISCADTCCSSALVANPVNLTVPLLKDMLPYWNEEDHEKVMNILKELFGAKGERRVSEPARLSTSTSVSAS